MFKNTFKEFREFAVKGNAIDLAIGVVVGAAFTSIVNSLVNDVISPPLSLLTSRVNFASQFVTLQGGQYETVEQAKAAGAITLNYGNFISAVINFLVVAFIIFLLVRAINRFRRAQTAPRVPSAKKCPYCLTTVDVSATRCPACTSQLPADAK